MESNQPRQKWLPMYTLVLLLNLAYIIIFYFITQAFS